MRTTQSALVWARRCRILLLGLLVLAGRAAEPAERAPTATPVEATWLYGRHTLPPSAFPDGSARTFNQSIGEAKWTDVVQALIRPGAKVPGALYLHGCNGWSTRGQDEVYRDLLLAQGYAIFMPDSFRRPGRERCAKQGRLEERIRLRSEEVEYALARIQELAWVDQQRVILVGFSEGGNTVDSWAKPGFAAHIILGSACTTVGGSPAAPVELPVLAIVGQNDHHRPGLTCRVERTVGGSRSIVIAGASHWIAEHPETQDAIRTFLRRCCR